MRFFRYLKRLFEVQMTRRSRENAKRAKEVADKLFPREKWIKVENGIYLSPRRAIGKKTNYKEELRDARILRDTGSTVYLVPEPRAERSRKFDAIVNGEKMEFKNMHGASFRTLEEHFLNSRRQAPNVFLNLEKSPLNKREIINALYRARNSADYTEKSKNFPEGKIILKINGSDSLVYLDVNKLKISR
jgi:hypothetical protein